MSNKHFNKQPMSVQIESEHHGYIIAIHITLHMPHRTSKILLVRLTANENAVLFQIRVTCFARYTV